MLVGEQLCGAGAVEGVSAEQLQEADDGLPDGGFGLAGGCEVWYAHREGERRENGLKFAGGGAEGQAGCCGVGEVEVVVDVEEELWEQAVKVASLILLVQF